MFQSDPYGLVALIAFAMCCALAVVLYRVGTSSSVARKLSLLLVVEGVTLISTGYIDLFLTPSVLESSWYPGWLQAEEIIHTFGDCAMLALYPPFLAAALQTKLTRPFTDKRTQLAIVGGAGLLFFMTLLTPLTIGATLLYLMLSLLFGFALVASINAWCVASGMSRHRARAFTLAFGLRDICWGIAYGWAIWAIRLGEYEIVDSEASSSFYNYVYLIYALGTLFAVPLVAYGILRTQLFDIDLRIRWTIKQSTLAAAFVAIMFLISEGAERLLSAELGNFAGLLAAALVVFFLAPLQRFAERVASAAMPNTKNTPEYTAYRKMQVYESALTEALLDGDISEKERSLLNTLRDTLGVSATDAESLERDLRLSHSETG
jgi:hypothetical protein